MTENQREKAFKRFAHATVVEVLNVDWWLVGGGLYISFPPGPKNRLMVVVVVMMLMLAQWWASLSWASSWALRCSTSAMLFRRIVIR
jgi:hypothetical protein